MKRGVSENDLVENVDDDLKVTKRRRRTDVTMREKSKLSQFEALEKSCVHGAMAPAVMVGGSVRQVNTSMTPAVSSENPPKAPSRVMKTMSRRSIQSELPPEVIVASWGIDDTEAEQQSPTSAAATSAPMQQTTHDHDQAIKSNRGSTGAGAALRAMTRPRRMKVHPQERPLADVSQDTLKIDDVDCDDGNVIHIDSPVTRQAQGRATPIRSLIERFETVGRVSPATTTTANSTLSRTADSPLNTQPVHLEPHDYPSIGTLNDLAAKKQMALTVARELKMSQSNTKGRIAMADDSMNDASATLSTLQVR